MTASNRVWCPVYLQRLCEAHLLPLSLFPCCLPPNHFRTTTSSWQLKLSADQGTKSSSRNHSRKKQAGPTLRSWARDEACTSDDLPRWSHRPSLLVQPTTEHKILFWFFFLAILCGMEHLSSLTRDPNPSPLRWKHSLNHWTIGKSPEHTAFAFTLLPNVFPS